MAASEVSDAVSAVPEGPSLLLGLPLPRPSAKAEARRWRCIAAAEDISEAAERCTDMSSWMVSGREEREAFRPPVLLGSLLRGGGGGGGSVSVGRVRSRSGSGTDCRCRR